MLITVFQILRQRPLPPLSAVCQHQRGRQAGRGRALPGGDHAGAQGAQELPAGQPEAPSQAEEAGEEAQGQEELQSAAVPVQVGARRVVGGE